MRIWLSAVSVAVLAAAAAPVCAQQTTQTSGSQDAGSQDTGTPDSGQKSDTPTQVTVTARAGQGRNVTAAKTVVDRDALEAYGDATIGDALKRIPGVSVGRDGGIALHGLSGYTQVLLNGQPAPPDFSITSLPPESVERVEITWTPTADMRGDAIAGTINIILRKSVRHREVDARFGLDQGKAGPGADLSATLTDRKGRLSYVLDANLSHSDDINTDTQTAYTLDAFGKPVDITDTYDRYHFRTDAFTLTPNLTLAGDNGESTSLQGLFNTRRQDIFRGQTSDDPLGTPLPYADNQQYIIYNNRMERLDLDHSRKLTEVVSLKLKASASDFHRGGFVHQTGHDAGGDLILDDTITSTADQQSAATSGSVSFQLFKTHALDLGWDGSEDWRNERRTEVNQPLPGALAGNSDDLFFSQVRRVAVYIQDNWTIGEKWSAYLGLRDEQMDTLSHGTTYAGIHNRLTAASPVVQALWKPDGTSRDQFRFAFARTFKAPDIASLVPRPYVSYNNTVFQPEGLGNPNLKPELAWGTDVSYEHDWKSGSTVHISAFHRDITGVILTQTLLENGVWVSSPVNAGKAAVSGITLDGKTTWQGFDLQASVTGNQSKVAALPRPGNVLGGQSPAQLDVQVERKIGALWKLGGSYDFVQGLMAQETALQRTKYPDGHSIDIYAVRQLSKHLNLRFSVGNVLHIAYRQQSIYAGALGNQVNYSLNPAYSTFHLNLEVKD